MRASQPVTAGVLIYTGVDGLGTVQAVVGNSPGEAVVQFDSGVSRRVSLESSSLAFPSAEGFIVTATRNTNEMSDLLLNRPADVVLLLLRDAPTQSMETRDIKERLVPDWIKEDEWNRWWNRARDLIKKRSDIDTTQAKQQRYAIASKTLIRKVELQSILDNYATSSAVRLACLRELLAIDAVQALDDTERAYVRNQLDKLNRIDTTEPWVRAVAALLSREQGWVNGEELQLRFRSIADTPVRWRPVTKFEQFQTAQDCLMQSATLETPIPAAVWSGLLTRPQMAGWLLRQLLSQKRSSEVSTAIASAFSAVYPPDLEPIEAEPSWSQDLVETISQVRADWEYGPYSKALDWVEISDAILDAVSKLEPAGLEKKGFPTVGALLVSAAIEWYPDKNAEMTGAWLANRVQHAMHSPHLQGMVVESLLARSHPNLTQAFLEQMADVSDPAFADLCRLAMEKSSGLQRPQATLAMIAGIVRAYQRAVGEYTRTSSEVLKFASQLAKNATVDQFVPLLSIVQASSKASPGHSDASLATQHSLWRKILDATLAGSLVPSTELIALNQAFIEELSELLKRRESILESEIADAQEYARETTQQLEVTRHALSNAEQKRQEALRSLAKSQTASDGTAGDKRLLMELTQTLAEVDRVTTVQKLRPEAVAQLLQARLNRLLRQTNVLRFGVIGETVPFDPSRHEIIDGVLGPQKLVEIVEVGYEQGSDDDDARISLKPALVRATGG